MIKLYKESLKRVESEEVLDLLIFRLLGFFIALLLRKTSVTPNNVTILSMILGLFSGYFLYIRDYITGAILIFLANLLDCVDGQLARLKKQFSPVGRILDGFADYVTYVSSYVGLAFGLTNHYDDITYLFIGLFAGASTIIQASIFDDYRNIFIGNKNTEALKAEIEEVRIIKSKTQNIFHKVLYFFYIPYLKNQIKTREKTNINYVSSRFIRLFTFVGSTTHISLLIFLLLINKPEYYFWIISTVFNLYLLLLIIFRKKLNK